MKLIRNFKKKKITLNHKQGFTLVELLVSIFIIALMSGLFLANYHGANNRSKLIMSAQKMVSDIRSAQSYALGSMKFEEGDVPSGGWGVHFSLSSPTNYIIFADNNEDHIYTDSSEDFQTIDLPAGVKIDSISIGDGTLVDIIFEPPEPIVHIVDDEGTPNTFVRIQISDGESIKNVEINFFGLVDVVD